MTYGVASTRISHAMMKMHWYCTSFGGIARFRKNRPERESHLLQVIVRIPSSPPHPLSTHSLTTDIIPIDPKRSIHAVRDSDSDPRCLRFCVADDVAELVDGPFLELFHQAKISTIAITIDGS